MGAALEVPMVSVHGSAMVAVVMVELGGVGITASKQMAPGAV